MNYRKKQAKVDKYTLREMKRKKREEALKGDGEYLFVNNTRGDLTLEKNPIKSPIPSNPKVIPMGQTFVGDSYFLKMVPQEVRLIEVLRPGAKETIGGTMPDQKLILDQPNRFTNQGQTEHVMPNDKQQPLIENKPNAATPAENKLITEDPLEGVEILLG